MFRAGCILSALLVAVLAAAPDAAAAKRREPSALPATRAGRPKVVLDRLDVPEDLRAAGPIKKTLRRALAHESRRADWGTGRGATITYRFVLKELVIEEHDDGIRVRCSAVGKLPGGRSAKSQLAYGGNSAQRAALVRRVLQIVVRGVIGRLAELERVRRGDLSQVGIRPPVAVE